MYILHPYAIPVAGQQGPTWQALHHSPLPVDHVPCGRDSRYEEALRDRWRVGEPFIVCEQDIVPTPAMLSALAACPHAYCTQQYLLIHDARQTEQLRRIRDSVEACPMPRWLFAQDFLCAVAQIPALPASVLGYQTLAHRVATPDGWRWAAPDDRWADFAGLGLTKITPCGAPEWTVPGTWRDLDSRVMTWMHRQGIRWHVHTPLVPHYHVLSS